MVEPWIENNLFEKPCPDVDPYSPARYVSDLSKQQGRIAELYLFVPPTLHSIMNKHSYFSDMVSVGELILY
jgi:hypothetical protein